ncbi:site-specific DNA-methyltransferase [Thermodesulfovibrionales bacterium]|nr:site-specific DNA-methyltransferase [Thermodesulfovibrionales bacterium]
MKKKYIDSSWDFRRDNTKEYTHCYHSYPAMMIPQVARRLIDKYGKKSKLLFDPYCGTGTSLVEANLKNSLFRVSNG